MDFDSKDATLCTVQRFMIFVDVITSWHFGM